MAIQDDFVIDVVNKRIYNDTAFVYDRPVSIYTVNELYKWLQDTFDEPGFLQFSTPMSAQTPTQYTLINGWFIDDETMKCLYGGSIQTSSWAHSGSTGITQLRWQDTPTVAPDAVDIGEVWTGGTSGATGVVLAVDTARQVAWVRNTSVDQFDDAEAVTGPTTDPNFDTETNNGVLSGESIWANMYSVGSKSVTTEIYIGQEDDYMGGTAFHGASAEARLARRMEKVDEWWDADVDFATGSPNLLGGAGHFDILMKVQEAGTSIDGRRLFAGARQYGTVYSHFELVGGVGNYVVPFASTGADLNAADGPYSVSFDARSGNDLEVGDVLENTTGAGSNEPESRLRAIVTAVTGAATATGSIEFYLIGENEASATYDRTLKQLADNDNLKVRGDTTVLDVNGTPAQVTEGPADIDGMSVTFGNAQYDINEDSTDEEYAAVIDCSSNPLAQVYKFTQFLSSRGDQDGTTPDSQDELLDSAHASKDEAGEFFRAAGDITVPWDGRTGTAPAEGSLVANADAAWTASGVVVALSDPTGSAGQLTLTQVKGTWSDGDSVAIPGNTGTAEVTINGTPSSITDNTGAPFGSFAGGRWFVAQGIVLINVAAADANNWETKDLTGGRIAPPTQRTITFAGLVANDRAALFEVDTAGEDDVRKDQNGIGAAGAAIGDTTLPLDSNVALDVPSTNHWIRVVDTSDAALGTEFRFFYTAVSGQTVTLDTGAGTSGTATSAGSSTLLNDTGAFASFGTVGNLQIGMEIYNSVDLSRAVVLRKVSNDQIETTPLTGGTDDTWDNTDTWVANRPTVALVDADTVYFPFIDGVSTGTEISSVIKYVESTPCVARARFSDPDIGGTRILPYVQKSITVTDADLTVTAIRTEDTIAT